MPSATQAQRAQTAPVFNYAQLEGIWIQAGGNKQNAPMAAAIAMAESGGRADATSPQNHDGSYDRGLWQINSGHGPSLSTYDVMGNAKAAIYLSNNGRTWTAWCTAYSDAACGYKGGIYLGQGSPFYQYLNGNIPPDINVAINATNAQANLPQYSLAKSTSSCSPIMVGLLPGVCIAEATGAGGWITKEASKETEKIAIDVIRATVGIYINPMIQFFGGIIGMVGGAILMIGGVYMIFMDTRTGQAVKGGVQSAAGTALWLAGPEAGAAGELGAGQSTRQSYRMGGMQMSRTQRSTQPTQRDILNNETRRYESDTRRFEAQSRIYQQQSMNWRTQQRTRPKQPQPSRNGSS